MDLAPELSGEATRLLERAREIADDVLFPAAAAVDAAERIPPEHLDLLAAEGLYGPPEDLPRPVLCRIIETLASGCLATTFVWLQHLGSVRAVRTSRYPHVRQEWLEPLSRGVRRAGTVQAALRPGPASVVARAVDGGYLVSGSAPWVTGWGQIDTMLTAARDASDTVIWALVDAVPGDTLRVEPLHLVAVDASRTVVVHFEDHFVPSGRVTGTEPFAAVLDADATRLRLNGSLALGLVARCARMTGSAALTAELDAARSTLDAATPDELPRARAEASALAVRAAAALATSTGARAVIPGSHAERLTREALFLLVFGSRPSIREALLRRLGG